MALRSNVIEFKLIGKENVSGAFNKSSSAMQKAATVARVAATAVTAVGVATTAAIVGAYKFANVHAIAEDAVGKFALRLGTTSDVLSKFHGAALLGGQSARQMDLAIQRFNRRIGDSIKGLGEATKHFDNLGLSAKKLANMPLEERMYAFADALNKVENPAQRLSYAVGLLESEGAGFLQTIKNGSQSLKDVAKDLEFLGGVISPQAAANAAAYTSEMGRFHLAVSGLGRAIADELIPYLTVSTKETTNWMAKSREGVREFTKATIINISAAYFFIRDTFDTIGKIIKGAFDWKSLLKDTLEHVKKFFIALYNTSSEWLQIASAFIYHIFKTAFKKVVAIAQWAYDNVKNIWKGKFSDLLSIQDLGEQLRLLSRARLGELNESLKNIQLSFRESGKAGVDEFGSPLDRLFTSSYEKANALYEKLNQINEAAKEQTGGIISPPGGGGKEDKDKKCPDLTTHLEEQTNQYATFYEAISAHAEAFGDRVGNIYAQLGAETFSLLMGTANAAGQAFASVITGAQSMGNALKNLFKQTLAQGVSMLIRIGIQRLILKVLNVAAVQTESIKNTAAGLKAVYLNSFASAAAIPIYGWAMAPEVAMANLGIAAAGAAAASGTGAALGGAAHGGLDYVPQESTYLLNKGERVLSPRQNQDLVEFLKNEQSTNTNVVINKIEILPNATNAKALLEMDSRDVERVVADKLYAAFERLANQGIKMQGVP